VLWALGGALALAGVVFFLLPAWLTPAPAPVPRATEPVPAQKAEPATARPDAAREVRERLLAEEAASRYRAESDARRDRGAATWAAAEFARAGAVGDEAAAAFAARDYGHAVERYQEGTRLLAAIDALAEPAFQRVLADGDAALAAGSAARAAEAFGLALRIRPDDARARRGLDRAGKLDDVLARVAAGEAQERDGKLAEAREAYAAALALDPEFAPAQAALKRLNAQLASQRFGALMTRGLSQLERSDWTGAEQSFGAALELRAGDRSAADGLARAKQGLQRQQLSRMQAEGRELESAERWEEALGAYRRAAAIDPAMDFARQGIVRSERMIALHARIDGFLADPQRLYSPRVRNEAQQLLAALQSERAAGPRLAAQRQRLAAALQRASAKVTVQLTSDNATEVTLYRVGPLGKFLNRDVALTPGTYTLVGSRPGYRDARVEVTVKPDGPAPRVFIVCKEPV
jgi:hypothetical protein